MKKRKLLSIVIYIYIYKFNYTAKKLPPDVNHKGVFACNELDLEEVKVYGFDYDYTLACYKPSMDYLLYNLGRDMLIQKYKVYLYLKKNRTKIKFQVI